MLSCYEIFLFFSFALAPDDLLEWIFRLKFHRFSSFVFTHASTCFLVLRFYFLFLRFHFLFCVFISCVAFLFLVLRFYFLFCVFVCRFAFSFLALRFYLVITQSALFGGLAISDTKENDFFFRKLPSCFNTRVGRKFGFRSFWNFMFFRLNSQVSCLLTQFIILFPKAEQDILPGGSRGKRGRMGEQSGRSPQPLLRGEWGGDGSMTFNLQSSRSY